MLKTETIPSSDGKSSRTLYLFLPDTPPRAILQICHGMCEYLLRYQPFAEYLCAKGVLVCGIDNAGHGQGAASTAKEEKQGKKAGDPLLGHIPGGKNLSLPVEDQYLVYEHLRKIYRHLPYLLFGHSMGSFLARKFITRYPDAMDGVILCGTSAGNQPLFWGILLARLLSLVFGKKHPSPLLMKLSFGHYNDKFPGEEGSAWLSRNRENVQRYDGDPLCGFTFTASTMGQMFGLLREINSEQWYNELPLSLPLLLVSGEEDPVGGYGNDIREIYEKLQDRELCNVAMKLYPGDRHEILNEEDRETVYADILAFLEEVIEGVNAARTEHYSLRFGGNSPAEPEETENTEEKGGQAL